MQVSATSVPDVLEFIPDRRCDERGHFSETWNAKTFAQIGINLRFCQDNESFSTSVGTVRGLHCQLPPASQAKLVRVVTGEVFDVAVDIRKKSKTYMKWAGVNLSAELGNQLFIPAGFLHGFVTLTPNTRVAYKCSDFYAPQLDRGVRWNDPKIGIDWGFEEDQVTLSDKDKIAPYLANLDDAFDCVGLE